MTETWIKSDDEAKRFQIPGYTHYYHFRSNKIGGGVSIFVTNSLKHHLFEGLSQDDNHYLWIHLKELGLDIGTVYKPGRTQLKNFLETFSIQLNQRKRAIIFGDFNLDLLEPSSSVNEYMNTLEENGYKIINKITPEYCTREGYQKKSLLDHVSTNLKDHYFNFALIESSLSDHKQIFLEIKKYKPPMKPKIVYEAIDYVRLEESAKGLIDRQNKDYTIFEHKLLNTIENCKEQKTKILNPPRQDWINIRIIDKIKRKNQLYLTHKKSPRDEIVKQEFLIEKKVVSEEIQKTKSEYYQKQFLACKKHPKKMWRLINCLSHNKIKEELMPCKLEKGSTVLTDGNEICEYFNEFFATIGPTLAEAIPLKYHNNKIYTRAVNNAQQLFTTLTSFSSVTKSEVLKIIDSLDINTSSGIDKINTKTIKCVKYLIVDELINCINNCLEQGKFPDELKVAKVTPIYKSGSRFDPGNYRPISVLPVLSKIFEKILYNRLEAYLNSIHFLSAKQYGFRPKSNTLSATVDLISKVKNNIDGNKVCLGIFIDLKKAFDTVSHNILLNKLVDLGITGNALKIFESYLTGRSQIVKIGKFQSSAKYLKYGIPQGSLLGPLLFLIYINNICNLDLKGEISLYADDTCLFYFGYQINSIIKEAQNDLNLLNTWFQCNLLTLNINKTHFVIFSAKNKKITNFEPLKINNIIIKRTYNEKYLGITLDSKLTWKPHIESIKSKLRSLSGAIRGIVRCLPRNVRYTVYNSLVKPHIDYLVEIWGSAAKSTLNDLQISQNKLIKTLFHYNYLTPTVRLYNETKIMNINKTYEYYTCVLIRKILSKEIKSSITFNTKNNHPLLKRLRNPKNIILNRIRTNYGRKNITFEGAQLYNKLPDNIKNAKNLHTFKNLLKKHLINN